MTGIQGKIAVGLRVLIGLLFLGAGLAKLAGVQHMIDEFDQVGFGQWLRFATGLAEVGGALLLVRARTVSIGAAALIAVCAGALYAQATVLHQDVVHPILIVAMLGWLAWSYSRTDAAVVATA